MPSTTASPVKRKIRCQPAVGRPVACASIAAETSFVTCWQKDPGGCYVSASANYGQFFGLSAVATPLGQRDHDLFPESLARWRDEAERKAMLSGESQVFTEEHADRRRELVVTPIFDATGQICGTHGVARDSGEEHYAHLKTGTCNHEDPPRLRKSHELLRKLAIRREQEQEEVRRDITQRMHEELAQDVSALRMYLKLLARKLPDPENPLLGVMDEITARCIARIRDMVKTLRPRALDLGIVPALRWLADDFYQGLELEFRLDLPEQLEVSEPITTFLFRAAQEALLNVALHAAATRIGIRLEKSRGRIRLCIDDNGCGFDTSEPPPEGAIGLLGMAEQALHMDGHLRVFSIPHGGTTVEIAVPLRAGRKNRL